MRKEVFVLIVFVFFMASLDFISPACTFRRLDWGPGTIVENNDATINIGVQGDTCQGKVVSLSVKEYDRGQTDDTPTSQPASVTIPSNSPQPNTWVFAYGAWGAKFMEDTDHSGETNPPEYYLIATLDGVTVTTKEDRTYVFSNQYLNVTKYVAPQCADSDSGKTYNTFGTLTATNSSGTFIFDDDCINASNLKEYYCNNNQAAYESYKCAYGCINGACNLSQQQNPPQCTNNSWCQSQHGANYICSKGNCILNSSQNPPINSSVYHPTSCTNSEIRKVWDSVFKESSANTTIFKNGTSASECGYFAYKAQGSKVHYMIAGTIDLFGYPVFILVAEKLGAKPEFIDILNELNSYSDVENLSGLLILHNFTKLRPSPLNFSDLNLEFTSFFKETPTNWTEVELIPPLANETAYMFEKNTSSTVISGTITLKRDNIQLFLISANETEGIENQTIKEQANQSINKKQEKINRIKIQVNTFPAFSRETLNEVLAINESQRQLDIIKREYQNASLDEEFEEILTEVSEIDVLDSLAITKTADSLLFFPGENSINPEVISSITQESYNSSKESSYITAIKDWNFENFEIRVNFKEISGIKTYQETPILKIFDVNLIEKETISDEFYLIIRNIGGLKFQNDYGQQVSGDYTYIPLSSGQQTITLLTTEDLAFTDLPIFLSPHLSELQIKDTPNGGGKGGISKWLFYIVLMLFIILMVIVAYVMMRGWYKNKYESYLFKNKSNLYNLLSYIGTAKTKGIKNEEIKARLRKTGWRLEQINYAIKKFESGAQMRIPMPHQPPPGARFVRKSS